MSIYKLKLLLSLKRVITVPSIVREMIINIIEKLKEFCSAIKVILESNDYNMDIIKASKKNNLPNL
jgi:hypothetical protein